MKVISTFERAALTALAAAALYSAAAPSLFAQAAATRPRRIANARYTDAKITIDGRLDEAPWQTAESDCCLVHYITGTDAERDLYALLEMVDEQAALASQRIGVVIDETLPIIFLPRVLGHGGFTAGDLGFLPGSQPCRGRHGDRASPRANPCAG